MVKEKASLRWRVINFLIFAIIFGGLGFSWGVHHQAVQDWDKEQNFIPNYSSRIVVKFGDAQVVAYTIPRCDSSAANDDGYWFNTTVCDPEAFIVVETIEWPFKDGCN